MLALLASLLPLAVSAAVIDVQVGKGGLVYDPPAVSAKLGDTVVFHFVAKNHTATQSSFAAPCSHKEGGFDSGFQPVAADSTAFPTFSVNVTTTDPIWVFCNQAASTPNSHCGQGMVFAINCPPDGSDNSLQHFKESALAIGAQLQASTTSGGDGYGYGSPAATTTAVSGAAPAAQATGTVHAVQVGANGALTFEPPNISAKPGDIVSFSFMAKNHSVTQSSFATPCQRLNSATGQLGIDSDYVPVAAGSQPVVWNLTVNDTSPLWFYCKQGAHCAAGMVFAVNSDESASSQKTFAAFQAAAKGQNTSSTTSSQQQGQSGAGRVTAGLSVGLLGAAFALLL